MYANREIQRRFTIKEAERVIQHSNDVREGRKRHIDFWKLEYLFIYQVGLSLGLRKKLSRLVTSSASKP